MTASKSFRRLIAVATAALLLACQTAAVVHACDLGTSQPGATSEPCHDSGHGNRGDNNAPKNCQSQHVSPLSPAELGVLAAAALPTFAERVDHCTVAAEMRASLAPQLARAESPPLTILHCRLRN